MSSDAALRVAQAMLAQGQPAIAPPVIDPVLMQGGMGAVAAEPMMLPGMGMQMAGNNELENLRRIIAKDKGGAKPITPPMSPEETLEQLRRLIRENS